MKPKVTSSDHPRSYPAIGKHGKGRVYGWRAGIFALILLAAFCLLPSADCFAQGSASIGIGATVPTNCTPLGTNSRVLFWKRSGTNVGLYECTATNTWTRITAVTTTGTITANTFAYWGAGAALASEASLSYHGSTYSSASSFQPIGIDYTVGAGVGKDVASGTSYQAPIMGNLIGATLTKTGNYLGGGIFAYSVTGTQATHYPAGAVLGQITDGVTAADGAFVAYIDGDSAQTNAVAGYAFKNNNSTAASGFDWAIDAYSPSHDGFNALGFKKGFARIVTNAAPGSPPATTIATWADSTDNNFKSIDSSGNASQTVRALTGVDGQVVTSMPTTGVLATTTAEVRLGSVAAVDMNTATPTVLYTSPTGRSTVVTRVVVRNCSTSMTTASYSFGWNSASFNDVIANATHTELTGNTLYTILIPKTGAKVGTTTQVFDVLMNTLQGGAATCTISTFGYTF